jgi:hypothetical protein
MGQTLNDGVAMLLAALITASMSISLALADGLTLPKEAGEPISLVLAETSHHLAEPSDLLAVYVGALPCCEDRNPIAGRYAREDNTLSFVPAFGFEDGQSYVARMRTDQGDEYVTFSLPGDDDNVPAFVTQVFPSEDTLPENVLRFYLHFSTPMQPHVAFDFIKLRNANGDVDEAAFMRFKQELWNEDRTRLTVLVDPGRIKRNVATNVELGPALLEGQMYTLAVDAGWLSADGRSTLPGFTKTFRVGAPLRELPSVEHWEYTRPCVGTQGSLYVTFDRPFDRHLMAQKIRVTDNEGQGIEGAFIVGSGERSLIFTPDIAWSGETIQILVDPTLEDVAANNFRDLLDHLGHEDVSDIETLTLPISLSRCSG